MGHVRCPGYMEVSAYWKHWPCLFPQHGPGPKHLRRIELAHRQADIVSALPHRLLRGLIHSDGWRGNNHIKGTGYPRYQFSNSSRDIQRIFTDACEVYGVRWRRSNWRTISVARKRDVAKLDAEVDFKT